jgi:hypothetical protein
MPSLKAMERSERSASTKPFDASALTEHATRAGMPADDIIPVIGRIVVGEEQSHHLASFASVEA